MAFLGKNAKMLRNLLPRAKNTQISILNVHVYRPNCRHHSNTSSYFRHGCGRNGNPILLQSQHPQNHLLKHGYVVCGVAPVRFISWWGSGDKSDTNTDSSAPLDLSVDSHPAEAAPTVSDPAVDINTLDTTTSAPSAVDVSSLPDGYIPDAPPIPLPGLETELNALGEPSIYSQGLGNYTPSGFVQMALETLHCWDLPWWSAIVIGTVCVRFCMFPLVILSQKNAASMHNHMPTVQKLQQKFTKARMSGNSMEAARIGYEMQSYMKRNKVNPLKNMLVPVAQVPVFLSVFYGLRTMTTLPVESMKTGGMLWFTDLTIPDPFYALPVLTMATFLITVEFGVDTMKASDMGHTVKWVMRAMPFIIMPVIMNFPTAMLCYWFTSNAFSLLQVMFLRIPGIREKLGIPPMVKHAKKAEAPKKKKVPTATLR